MTGLNSPLYARKDETGLQATLNQVSSTGNRLADRPTDRHTDRQISRPKKPRQISKSISIIVLILMCRTGLCVTGYPKVPHVNCCC